MQMCKSLKNKSPWLEFYSSMPPPSKSSIVNFCMCVCLLVWWVQLKCV